MGATQLPKCFHRRSWLGKYAGTKTQWQIAYSRAREVMALGGEPDPATSGLTWKAMLIVQQRNFVDPLSLDLEQRFVSHQIINEIIRDGR